MEDTESENEASGTTDALEARLARQPLRTVPPAWRKEILARAQGDAAGAMARPASPDGPRDGMGWLDAFLSRFPVAWAGFAALWLFIFAANSTDRWLNGTVAATPRAISAEQIAAARAQRVELWTLAGLEPAGVREPDPADRPRDPVLRPRSSLRKFDRDFGSVEPAAAHQPV